MEANRARVKELASLIATAYAEMSELAAEFDFGSK